MEDTKYLFVRLTPELDRALDRLCETEERTRSVVVRRLLKNATEPLIAEDRQTPDQET